MEIHKSYNELLEFYKNAQKQDYNKKHWLWEFTKKIVWIVTIMFVTVYTFSCILLSFYPDSLAIQFVIENISDVFKVTVVAYVVKAGFENVCKIRRNSNGMGCEQLGNYTDSSDGNSRSD